VRCVERGGLPHLFIGACGRFGGIFFGDSHATIMEEPPGDAMWKEEAVGAGRGTASPRPPSAWRLHVGPRILPRGFEAQYALVGGLFLVCLLRICFAPSLVAHFAHIFPHILDICPAKTLILQYMCKCINIKNICV
jgi:hypothetical protein